jgi:hypothetical protein
MSNIPKPNTQFLSWFVAEYKNNTLKLTPRYQRNPIWSIGQKCFLIDSLISGCPIPQVFINIISEGSGSNRKTYYEVVDGQQRLRAILEFINDEYPLIATAAKAYPVSDDYKPHIGKHFSDMPPNLQDLIWNYPLAVQELRGWTDEQIRALFRRLNYVVERLNKQEMRHSQYFGKFVNAVEKLANEEIWDEFELFSRRDSQRMKDIEFISELFVLVIDGPQDQQENLDSFYAKYDVEFPKMKHFIQMFCNILKSLETIKEFIKQSRFTKKADFYGIFGAIGILIEDRNREPICLESAISSLKRLDKEMDKDTNDMTGIYSTYHSTVIEGPNKLPKRQTRIKLLKSILGDNLV